MGKIIRLMVLCLLSLLTLSEAAAFDIVRDGKPVSVIVLGRRTKSTLLDELYDTETPDELGEAIKEEEVKVYFGRKDKQ